MENISVNSAIAFIVFAFFLFYQNLHLRSIAEQKNALYYALWASTLIGALVGAFWIYWYAAHVIWYAPFMILVGAIVVILFASSIEKVVPPGIFSMIGFVAWPVAAFFMFKYIPPAPFLPVEPEAEPETMLFLLRLILA